jgi:hypothetical protein
VLLVLRHEANARRTAGQRDATAQGSRADFSYDRGHDWASQPGIMALGCERDLNELR